MLRFYKKLNFYSTFKTDVSRSEYLDLTTSVDGIILWLLIWLVNYVAMLLVVCQLSRDVIGYEDSNCQFSSRFLVVSFAWSRQ